jgi:peptidoglycan/LPS O-acetylase OafA/YrhL
MNKATSLYLDLVRFTAAFVVFLEHLREHTRNTFAAFWRSHPFLYFHLDPYSQTAVIVFFVLSGYVIAHVLATRENTLVEFSTSRLARLYSVAIPALFLAAVTNYVEASRYPNAFAAYQDVPVFFRYLGTALFVSHFWLWPDLEPANLPFWSLSFEAAYYVGIALFVFGRSYSRLMGLIALSLFAGPTMVLLAPTWLLGYGAYHFTRRRSIGWAAAAGLWVLSAALLLSCFAIEVSFRQRLMFLRMPDATVGGLLAAYAAALCFAANIFSFNSLGAGVGRLLAHVSGIIRYLGSMTFALYLFHQPVLSFLTVYPVADRSSGTQFVALIGATFLVVGTIGRLCEQSKGAYKVFFAFLWERRIVLLRTTSTRIP